MNAMQLENMPASQPPRTSTVLVFLAAFAVIVSWLVVYAVTNALIAADLMAPWPADADPRRQWMLKGFVGMFAVFSVVGTIFRWISNRQLRRIDQIADAEG